METIRLSELPNPGENPAIDKQIEIFARNLLRIGEFTQYAHYFIVEVNALETPQLKERHATFNIYEEKINGRIYTVLFDKVDKSLFEIR